MKLSDGAKKILDMLSSAGYECYAVGGCVRDYLMGRPVSDYDITTAATPKQTEAVLDANFVTYIETGLKHGTVTAIYDKTPYEITTFRTDGEYTDSRRPDSVNFVTNIKEDLSRRDFTVNAIAYNSTIGYVDLFSGRQDIKNKILRTVGDADARFAEDALRMLRALRFSSTLGFEIEEKTGQSILKNYPRLEHVANERVSVEIIKTLSGENFINIFKTYQKVFVYCLPWLEKIYEKHALEKFEHLYPNTIKQSQLCLCLMTILAFDKKLEKNASFERLKLSNELRDRLIFAQNAAFDMGHFDKNKVKWLMSKYGKRAVTDAATVLGKKEVIKEVERIVLENEPYRVSDLDINGQDLIEQFGIKGKEIGELLQKALQLVIEQKVPNNKPQIIKALRN